MEVKEMYVYWQNNSYSIYEGVRNTYSNDMTILPVKYNGIVLKEDYVNLAVANKEIIPDEVYFDGVENGRDCGCCGDRWSRLDEYYDKRKVYIFENREEFENYDLTERIFYVILSELKKADIRQ